MFERIERMSEQDQKELEERRKWENSEHWRKLNAEKGIPERSLEELLAMARQIFYAETGMQSQQKEGI